MIQKFELQNGIRVLVEENNSVRSAAIGLTCTTGSRHELPGEDGITHFIEHMLFKGTANLTSKEIATSIESRGGGLNAFTDKEQTTYYCRVLGQDAQNGIAVLSDMLCHSLFDSEELEKEKGVVLEEIKRSEDEPGDMVHEHHVTGSWPGHILGKPVIGTKATVSSFNRDHLVNYISRRYKGGHVCLSVAGDVKATDVKYWAEEHLGDIQKGVDKVDPGKPDFAPGENLIKKDVEQVHFCLGGEGVAIFEPEYYIQAVLDGILGGGMSARLFQEIREKRGMAYSVGSYAMAYSHGGLFTAYGGTSAEHWPVVQELIIREFQKIAAGQFDAEEVDRVKHQIAGNMVLALESMSSRMLRMTKNEIMYGRDVPIDETLAKVNAVTEAHLQDFAQRFLTPDRLRITAIVPN